MSGKSIGIVVVLCVLGLAGAIFAGLKIKGNADKNVSQDAALITVKGIAEAALKKSENAEKTAADAVKKADSAEKWADVVKKGLDALKLRVTKNEDDIKRLRGRFEGFVDDVKKQLKEMALLIRSNRDMIDEDRVTLAEVETILTSIRKKTDCLGDCNVLTVVPPPQSPARQIASSIMICPNGRKPRCKLGPNGNCVKYCPKKRVAKRRSPGTPIKRRLEPQDEGGRIIISRSLSVSSDSGDITVEQYAPTVEE